MARTSEMKRLSKIKSEQALEPEKAEYHEKYHKFKEEGKPFWPDVIFEDTIAILVVLGVLLALIFLKGVPLGNVADPASKEFVPRPEWYFLFLFQLLKYFPGSLEWVGIVLVPSAIILLLLFIPFIDRKRRPAETGISLNMILKAGAILSVFGVLFLTFKAYETSPPVQEEKAEVRMTSQEQFGRNIFNAQGCLSCHVLAGKGSGIPLDDIGSRMSVDQIHNYVENPQMINPASTMPAFIKTLTHVEAEAVARYLALFTTGAAAPRPVAVISEPETPSPTLILTPAVTPAPATPTPIPVPASEVAPVPYTPGITSGPTPAVATATPAITIPPSPVLTTAPATAGPSQPRDHAGRPPICLACHEQGIAGAKKIPSNHAGRTNEMCVACHKAP